MSPIVPPLDDPDYVPQHPPVGGTVPAVVEKWGPASQVRWFERFLVDLAPQPYSVWERFYCSSTLHLGECCPSCIEDGEDLEDACCCRGL